MTEFFTSENLLHFSAILCMIAVIIGMSVRQTAVILGPLAIVVITTLTSIADDMGTIAEILEAAK